MDCKYVRAKGHSATEIAATATSSPRPKGTSPRFRRFGGATWTGETNMQADPSR